MELEGRRCSKLSGVIHWDAWNPFVWESYCLHTQQLKGKEK
jgi:hypothetical protein